MEIAVKTLLMGLNPKITSHNQAVKGVFPDFTCGRVCSYVSQKKAALFAGQLHTRRSVNGFPTISAVLSGAKDVGVSSSQFEGFSVSSSGVNELGELKISIEVSGATKQTIFDEVFGKMVAQAQPIPGFRRVRGGKTPNIPRDILLEVLGASKVYKQVIKKIINSTIAAYIEKEGLKVSKNLRVEQSFEDLELMFEESENFSFDAILGILEMN
ncbi:hypothetical protein UlMin_016422 [Ulmus minor]